MKNAKSAMDERAREGQEQARAASEQIAIAAGLLDPDLHDLRGLRSRRQEICEAITVARHEHGELVDQRRAASSGPGERSELRRRAEKVASMLELLRAAIVAIEARISKQKAKSQKPWSACFVEAARNILDPHVFEHLSEIATELQEEPDEEHAK